MDPEIQCPQYVVPFSDEVIQLQEVDSLSTNSSNQVEEMICDVSQDADSIDNQESVGVTFDPKLDLNEELQAGYKILTDLMAHAHKYVNWPFMESLETTDPELFEEYQMRIEKPMWLKLSRFSLETD